MKTDSIRDKTDPSKQGMFSVMGRFTSEKYPILRRSEEILTDYRPTLRPKMIGDEDYNEQPQKGLGSIRSEAKLKNQLANSKDKKVEWKGVDFDKEIERYEHFVYKFRDVEGPPPNRYRPKLLKL